MPPALRQSINNILLQLRPDQALFAVLVAKDQLITYMKPTKDYHLQPSDIHLIINLISASTSFRAAQSWMPICLPKFNNQSVCALIVNSSHVENFINHICTYNQSSYKESGLYHQKLSQYKDFLLGGGENLNYLSILVWEYLFVFFHPIPL